MNAVAAIQTGLASSKHMMHMYLGDLADADLLVRPAPTANHIAWQLGHLIASEHNMLTKHFSGNAAPALPAGFTEKHGKDGAKQDSGFLSKQAYLDLFDKVRDATVAATAKLSEADLDRPSGFEWAPTLGAMLLLTSSHDLMHAGQFTVVRRKLGKPVLF